MSSNTPNLVLYSYFRSSCSGRLRIALNLKDITYDSKYVNLLKGEQSSEAYDLINPSHFVPSLQCASGNGSVTTLVQSVAMLEYLEESFPESTPLLPPTTDILGRAQVRALANVIACDLQPVTNLRILTRAAALGGSKEDWAKDLMSEGLAAYERLVATSAGKFSYGDQPTFADVCLVPAIWGAMRYGVDMANFPTVRRVFEAMSELDAVKKAHWNNQGDTPEQLRGH
jgi:maleylacetoacetate isomerase